MQGSILLLTESVSIKKEYGIDYVYLSKQRQLKLAESKVLFINGSVVETHQTIFNKAKVPYDEYVKEIVNAGLRCSNIFIPDTLLEEKDEVLELVLFLSIKLHKEIYVYDLKTRTIRRSKFNIYSVWAECAQHKNQGTILTKKMTPKLQEIILKDLASEEPIIKTKPYSPK